MINRRNVRIKVMQTLYTLGTRPEEAEHSGSVKILETQFNESARLLVYLIHFLSRVALYAHTDSKLRASKHVTTNEDLNVNTKVAGNMLLLRMLENPSFREISSSQTLDFEDTPHQVKRVYQLLITKDEYKNYIASEERSKKSETDLMKFIFNDLLLQDETFIAHIEEHFMNWDDDAELMNQLIIQFIQKPDNYNVKDLLSEEKWQFAKDLLQTVIDKKQLVTEMIKPRLKNWDSERIALLDMILMQMGVCEFLYFETIPPKVTINEYIDIAKDYSTQQSGQFVNGILDSIHKELVASNKIHKISFKQ